MPNESAEQAAQQAYLDLERAVSSEASADAARTLAQLLSAFDARRRRGETLALRETTRALGAS